MKNPLRLVKVFSWGTIIKPKLYERLQSLDARVFVDAKNEFKENREWWVIEDKGQIIAYCGSLYAEGVCIFVRAWVFKDYRGHGIQSKMIKTRLKAAKGCYRAITYVSFDGVHSMNNLIKNGFLTYIPQAQYAGKEFLYFYKELP